MPARALVLIMGLVFPATVLAQGAPQLVRFDQLEEIARQVVMQGHVESKGRLHPVDPLLPAELPILQPGVPVDLSFPALTSSIEKERELVDAWIAAYQEVLDGIIARSREQLEAHELVSKAWLGYSDGKLLQSFAKKYGAGKRAPKQAGASDEAGAAFLELQAVIPSIFARYADVYQKAQLTGAQRMALVKEREARARQVLKRYDFGPGLVETDLEGASLLWVKLAPSVRKVAEDYLKAMNAPAVVDASGQPMTWEGRTLRHLDTRQLPAELSRALNDLTGEFFVVRYAVKEGDEITDIMRVTGARLLYGDFYFVEYDDQMIVIRR